MRILIIEDDYALKNIILKRLKEEGYAADASSDGLEGLEYARSAKYDCIVLDLMLPGIHGLTVLQKLRGEGIDTHIIILTAMDSVEDRVNGLNTGADDYLVKPFSFDELLARIRALLRRQDEHKSNLLTLADLELDVVGHTVKRAGDSVALTLKEYMLLEYLMRNMGNVLTRSQIADHVWNYDFDCESNIVDVYIRYLRNKLDKGYEKKLIHTVRGIGYTMRYEEQ